jgi:hypothetical protein
MGENDSEAETEVPEGSGYSSAAFSTTDLTLTALRLNPTVMEAHCVFWKVATEYFNNI